MSSTSPISYPDRADVVIVGSGPVGATYARVLAEIAPNARILMVEVGPQLSDRAGDHVRNMDPDHRASARLAAEGAVRRREGPALSRPGVFLAGDANGWNAEEQRDMPGAGMSSGVGGMSAHWTCSVPRPGQGERVDFIDEDALDAALDRAEKLIGSTTTGFGHSLESELIRERLGAAFDATLSPGRPVQILPFACYLGDDGRLHWSSSATVLGPLAEAPGNFVLRADTLCRRILMDGDRATGVELEHLPSGQQMTVRAGAVVVAGDALRTPQLLWASGVRPTALGHYLNDQPQMMASVALRDVPAATQATLGEQRAAADRNDRLNNLKASIWVPFHGDTHPYHGQIMYFDMSPVAGASGIPTGQGLKRVGVVWFSAKEVRYEDRVSFSNTETDLYGMPRMSIHHKYTEKDLAAIATAQAHQRRAADALGDIVEGGEPRLLPSGSSLHYQGSTRMGPVDDGTSVCDPTSRVWGTQNLYVGGNGVIPTSTACNPTLTSMAFAVMSAEAIAARLHV